MVKKHLWLCVLGGILFSITGVITLFIYDYFALYHQVGSMLKEAGATNIQRTAHYDMMIEDFTYTFDSLTGETHTIEFHQTEPGKPEYRFQGVRDIPLGQEKELLQPILIDLVQS